MTGVTNTHEQDLMTTGEVARLLGVTTQHVRNLCDRGELAVVLVGTHRRIRRSDFEALQQVGQGLKRDQVRNLWLHQAVAGKLVMRPTNVIAHARRNLTTLRQQHPYGRVAEQFDTWERLLHGPIQELLSVLGSSSPHAIELRQNSPFAGVLTEHERTQVLNNFKKSV